MPQEKTAQAVPASSIHADTQLRDQDFVMKGHHCHRCYELFYVHSGRCRFLVNDDFYDLKEGGVILIPPMTLHYTRFVFGHCKRTVLLFRREDVSDEVRACMPRPELFFTESAQFVVPPEYRGQIEEWIARIAAEDAIEDFRSAPMRRCALQGLLLLCSRVCEIQPGRPAEIRTSDEQILQAARYISEHYSQDVTTRDVADAVGFSPNYLSRKFRVSAGIGLHEYLVFVRLQHAAQELVSTADSVTEIALRCGFSDSNYFKDSFKRKYGVTPRYYRRNT